MSNTRRITAPTSSERFICTFQPCSSMCPTRTLRDEHDGPPIASGDGRALWPSPLGPALCSHPPHDALATVLLESCVEAADLHEHGVSDGLLLLARRVLD